jgi:hypothetical protein
VSPGFSSQVFMVGVRAGLGDDTVRAGAPAAVHGGAGDDELVGGQAGVRLYGGPGDDRLVGGANSDQLDGGGGRDELHGGAGDDQLTDGDRDGVAGAGGPGPDILDGGTEAHFCCAFSIGDEVSYARRQASVTVDVAHRERSGERGEGDVVSDVESVIGGHGPDRLAGSNTRNRLMGQGGRDVLIGRGGPDELSNGGGPVSCGPGRDLIRSVSSRDQLDRDCEQLELNATYPLLGPRLPPYPKMERGRTAVFTFTCPYRDGDLDDPPDPSSDYCGGALTLREATGRHRLLGRATFRPGNWLYLGLRVALGPLGRAAIARPTGVWATVSLAGRNLDPPTSWSILLGRSVSPSR